MARRRQTAEQVITRLREAEVALAQGTVGGAGLQGTEVTGTDVSGVGARRCDGILSRCRQS